MKSRWVIRVLLASCISVWILNSVPARVGAPPPPRIAHAPVLVKDEWNNLTVDGNIAKVVGSVAAGSQVTVNGSPAKVDSTGDYYALVFLEKGQNRIRVESRKGSDTKTKEIDVTFKPPLAIRLDLPAPSTDNTSIRITGRVSDARASVTKDYGRPIPVAENGTFSVDVFPADSISVYAGLSQYDAYDRILLSSAGPPARWVASRPPYDNTTFNYFPTEISLVAGHSYTFDRDMFVRTDIGVDPTSFTIAVDNTTSLPDGLAIDITPSSFTIYPQIDYLISFTYKANPKMEPGRYNSQIILSPFGIRLSSLVTIESTPQDDGLNTPEIWSIAILAAGLAAVFLFLLLLNRILGPYRGKRVFKILAWVGLLITAIGVIVAIGASDHAIQANAWELANKYLVKGQGTEILVSSIFASLGVLLIITCGLLGRPRLLWMGTLAIGAVSILSWSGFLYHMYMIYWRAWISPQTLILSHMLVLPGVIAVLGGILMKRFSSRDYPQSPELGLETAEQALKEKNWFERHPNWTAGLFGHLLVFILAVVFLEPWITLGRSFIEGSLVRIIPGSLYYRVVLITILSALTLTLYIGMNAWYLREKGRSYRHLWWLLAPSVPICLLALAMVAPVIVRSNSAILSFVVIIILFFMQPVWFGIAAFMLLRLRNNNDRIGQ